MSHIVDGEFKSDKYPWCWPGFVPLKLTDPMAQDLLWKYAGRRRKVDMAFATDLEDALLAVGFHLFDLDRLTLEELQELKIQNLADRADIKSQIANAKAKVITDSVYADPSWYRKAESALYFKGTMDQAIAMKIQRRKAEAHQGREKEKAERTKDRFPRWAVPKAFMEVAREYLAPDVFEALHEQAKSLLASQLQEASKVHPHRGIERC